MLSTKHSIMTLLNTLFLSSLYDGSPDEKLIIARRLQAIFDDQLPLMSQSASALTTVHPHVMALEQHMQAMGLGQLCSRCAAGAGGGCCSAYMADNCDVIQILLNLLMGIPVTFDHQSTENCGFLGPYGCQFRLKPIFCLNYNCTHILRGVSPQSLALLYQLANTVLRQQAIIEDLLLTELHTLIKDGHIKKDTLQQH